MRILLINPSQYTRSNKNMWSHVSGNMPPLGLASIAAVLESADHEVVILDACAEEMTVEDVAEWFQSAKTFDIVGLTATTPLINMAIQIAIDIKSISPDTIVILGGVHPSVLPGDVLHEKAVDIVVRGEGEQTMIEIASNNSLETIDGISYRGENDIVHNPDRELISDLDSLPMAAYHLLPMKKYKPAVGATKREPAISMLATRGCPGRCTFCFRQFGKRLRCRNGRRLAQEVKHLQDTYGIKEICFYDDTFTAVHKEVTAFCEEIRALKLDITWSCFSRVDTFREDVFRLMHSAGCHQVMFGVESASPEILENINKRTNLEQAEEAIKKSMQIGIHVRAAFMFGNLGETRETMKATLDWAIRVDPDIAVFNITTPYPGSELFQWADENKALMTHDWSMYDLAHPILCLPTIDHNEVFRFYRYAFRRFYFRPKKIIQIGLRKLSLRGLREIYLGVRTVLGL